jgi:CRP-like cAMP-binding protein
MKNTLWENIFKNKQNSESDTILALKQVPVFKGLENNDFKTIEHIVHHRTYEKDEIIFKENTPGLGMYIILKGNVNIINDDAKSSVYAELSTGDFFGEISLVSEDNRSASAIAQNDCHLIAFFRTELMDIITRKPSLGNHILLNLAKTLGSRLKKANELLENSAKMDVV